MKDHGLSTAQELAAVTRERDAARAEAAWLHQALTTLTTSFEQSAKVIKSKTHIGETIGVVSETLRTVLTEYHAQFGTNVTNTTNTPES